MIENLAPTATANPGLATREQIGGQGRFQGLHNRGDAPRSVEAHHHGHRHGPRHAGRGDQTQGSSFLQDARHLIRDALKDFSRDLQGALGELGFDGGLVKDIVKGVMHATRDALRAGADFTAKLTVAAVSHSVSTSADGSSAAFNLVASSIEITVNHDTGEVNVTTADVSIDQQATAGPGEPVPHLLDIQDGDTLNPLDLLSQILSSPLLDGLSNDQTGDVAAGALDAQTDAAALETAPANAPAVAPALVSTPREALQSRLAPADNTDDPATAAPVAANAETDPAETDATETDAAETDGTTADATPADDAAPAVNTPQLLGAGDYTVRILLTAFQQSVNDRGEHITFLRFDATIPLQRAEPDPTPTDAVVTETPALPPADPAPGAVQLVA